MNAALLHSVVALALIIGFVVLTALGFDGNPLLLLLGGQAIGGTVQKAADVGAGKP